jgi:hypothetical protein
LESFANCSSLSSICIPSSVEKIGRACFKSCLSLRAVQFGSESKLQKLCSDCFQDCSSLQSITIPRSVEKTERNCFGKCCSLSEVLFESNSELRDLEAGAFLGCWSLRSICLPSSMSKLSPGTFEKCRLSVLTFESPSHLESLSLGIPDEFAGDQLRIPDSTRRLSLALNAPWTSGGAIVVGFGRFSHLSYWQCTTAGYCRDLPRPPNRGVFLHVSSKTLQHFREVIAFRD